MKTKASSSSSSYTGVTELGRPSTDERDENDSTATEEEEAAPFSYSLESMDSRIGFPSRRDFAFNIDKKLLVDRRCTKIGRVIGQGPHSVVYEGMYNKKPVAVKIIHPFRASEVSSSRKERFQREIVLLANTKHEGIVKFVGAAVDPTMILITELMRGGSLEKHLIANRATGLDLKLALSYALDISKAMEYLHARGIIHRDLKPGNILLNKSKTRAKVADFGLAREVYRDMTAEAGTYRWMAPEIFSVDPLLVGEKKRYNHKVDVYSFSIVLWELMANQPPFKGMNSVMAAYSTYKKVRPEIVDRIPRQIVPLVKSCWSEDPKSRPEFRDITEYLHTLYYTLYPPEVKPKPPAASRVFDIRLFHEEIDSQTEKIVAEGFDEASETQKHDPVDADDKKKPKPLLLRCFTCSGQVRE